MSTTNIQTFSGDVSVGGGLNISGSVTSTAGIDKVTLAEDATDASRRILFTTGSTGAQPLKTDAGIVYNPSTNTLTTGVFSGSGASITTLNGSNISSGTVAAARVATLNQNTTGSAATLTTARTIGGVSFNGSADINLPGVNIAGNQNTSGSASGITYTELDVNAPNVTSGTWTEANASSWGPPKFNNTYDKYCYNDPPGHRQWNIPTGMKSAYLSQLTWNTGGYVDVHGVRSDGALVFLRRVNTRQGVENTSHDGDHDGSSISFIGSGLDSFSAIRITNKVGRLHLTGVAFTQMLDGTEGTGMVHPLQLSATLEASQIPTLNQNTTGSAATLTTARTIGGVSFNGSAAINLPGVNIAGNQNTTGQAGTIASQANSATITASADAGNNTIVRRSASGYVFANYFNTTANDVSTGVTKVMVETGNDGYIRHGTAAAIRTFIGATSADTASTVAMRDSAGDINVRLCRSDYQNQTDCGAGIAFRNSTSDNYIRFCSTMSAVRSRIGCAALAGTASQNFSANTIYIGNSTSKGLRSVSGNYGTVQTTGTGSGNWEGYSVDGRWVFMSDDSGNTSHLGIYNDMDNEWAIYMTRNGSTNLYHNGGEKARTESAGLYMLGTPEMDGFIRHRGDNDTMVGFSTADTFMVRTSNSDRLIVPSSGGLKVYGVETTTNYGSGNRGYFKGGIYTNPANLGFGLYVQSYIRSSGSVSFSDQRIKSNIVDINDTYALDQLRGLKPKYYNYKDVKERGDESVIGFIAQEVKEVVPRAVSITDGEIPNIYTHANITSNNTVTFTNFNTSNLESNATTIIAYDRGTVRKELEIAEIVDANTIRFIDDISDLGCSFDENGNVITVTETITLTPKEYSTYQDSTDCTSNVLGYSSGNTFVSVEEYESITVKAIYAPVIDFYTRVETTYPGSEIYVWGQKIDDFHHINKDYLWTIGTAALQEVDRQQQADKLRISELETQVTSILTRVQNLENP